MFSTTSALPEITLISNVQIYKETLEFERDSINSIGSIQINKLSLTNFSQNYDILVENVCILCYMHSLNPIAHGPFIPKLKLPFFYTYKFMSN